MNSKEEVKLKAKGRMLKFRYGITLDEYNQMYVDQNEKCAICDEHYELGGHKGLFVDHDHKTNEVRGLLCRTCNTGIGHLGECEDNLKRAIKYLSVQYI